MRYLQGYIVWLFAYFSESAYRLRGILYHCWLCSQHTTNFHLAHQDPETYKGQIELISLTQIEEVLPRLVLFNVTDLWLLKKSRDIIQRWILLARHHAPLRING